MYTPSEFEQNNSESTLRLIRDYPFATLITAKLGGPLISLEQLMGAIVGFEITIDQIESKFKLSQNRTPHDREAVIRGLSQRCDEMSKKVLALMLET